VVLASKNGEVRRINVFIIPLTTHFGPDRPSSGDTRENENGDGILQNIQVFQIYTCILVF
jgi:hypothetical protein